MGKKEYLKPLICLMPVCADVITSSPADGVLTDGLESFKPEWLSPNGGSENA